MYCGQSFGQQMDTWLTADRAVNSPPLPYSTDPPDFNSKLWLFTPLAPADGTPINIWYDFVDFTAQDAVQHPNPVNYPLPYPNGFEHSFGSPAYLNPTGSIPGIPTLRRNDMNFNPSVEFNGSGNGQALHFRSNSRNEITVFIVFKARGMGNSAKTQRLLFGGDMDTYHSSTTNLSIGISNGNRFSIGRTWSSWDYFESGSIDLLGAPTIGTLVRKVNVDPLFEDEVFTTWVNGLPDINIIRNDVGAERDLYLFNRLGKHFNSSNQNRNLTGNIAEVILADGPLDANSIQRVESYLAIKYGITMNNTGQLGSIVGNQGYQYLAADGTVIWDPTLDPNYRFDIAGLGRDRYEDFESGLPGNVGDLKLRYNLHQRIAKSENVEAIVSISVNPDFINDNLETSRPIIDNTTWAGESVTTTSYLHNYLLWGNDHNSLNQVATELPPQFVSRIEREWQIQKTVSPGVDPIQGVSVRVDLSGSDILDNGNCGEISLIIDTDGDGDFLTGPITAIPATSVDVFKNAYFDGVSFEHLDVFTVAFVDTTPPTASNPLTITICDSAPNPDPTVVTDETDNCAVDTVTFVGDVSDGLPNPETITRIYRVTDIYGNFIDVQQTIYVFQTPQINPLADVNACDSYILPPITGTNLSGNEAYYDASGGPSGGGNKYNPSDIITSTITLYIYDEVGGISPVCTDEEKFTVSVQPQPDAGTDGATNICEGTVMGDAELFAQLGGAPDPGGTWSPAFAGAGVYTYTVPATAPCTTDATATVTVSVQPFPQVDTLNDIEVCGLFVLPKLSNGNYFTGPGGTGTPLSTGHRITNSQTIFIYNPGTETCSSVESNFTVTVTGFDIITTVQNEICWESMDGSVSVVATTLEFPLTVQLNSMTPSSFTNNTFNIDELAPGNYSMAITDSSGCQSITSFEIQPGGPNLGATIEPVYSCEDGMPINSILVTLADPSIEQEVLYGLDSTNPNDFVFDSEFKNISAGNHTLSIMHNNGCLTEIPFNMEEIEPVGLTLSSDYANEITATAYGGIPPYTYYFNNGSGTDSSTYTIERSGTFEVRVVDSNGCESYDSITMNFVDISIPDFFTPNNDGQNDYWKPRNLELFPDAETFIFDRYGRKIKILGQLNDGWDGTYESKPLPSGDYWYIVKLNDSSSREFVGHFTLYR